MGAKEQDLELLLSWWDPLRAALGGCLSARTPRKDMPLWRSGSGGRHLVAAEQSVEGAFGLALESCEAQLVRMSGFGKKKGEDLDIDRRSGMIEEMAAEAAGELARMGFFKEALGALNAFVAAGSREFAPNKALSRLMLQAPLDDEALWRGPWSSAQKMEALADSPAWASALEVDSAALSFRHDPARRLWPSGLALAGARGSRVKANAQEKKAAARLCEKALDVARQEPHSWHIFCQEVAIELGRAKIPNGEVSEQVWSALPIETQVGLACEHASSSKMGSRSLQRVIARVEALAGTERESAGALLSVAAWGSMDAKKIDAVEAAFADEEPQWLERGLSGMGGGKMMAWALKTQYAVEGSCGAWARKALLRSGLMSPSPSGFGLTFPTGRNNREQWGGAIEALRAARLAAALKKEAPAPGKKARSARL
jgi:hypothetical protein